MRNTLKLRLGLMALLPALLLAVGAAHADIIVLKSGRRISAGEVVDEGQRYSYETSAGRMSVRKDLVERIERGSGVGIGGGAASEIPLVAPRIESTPALDEIARLTVRDGAIDRNYISKLESEAQSGGSGAAAERVALAHHAAAQLQLATGDYEQAIGHYRRALNFSADHIGVLLNIAHLHLKRSEYTAALEYLERARRVEPDSADVAKLMGWAYYGSNKIEQAVREWQRAYKLRPDADVERALEKARRDQEAESEYREGETRHFTLRYHGDAAPDLAREMLRTLEIHFRAIAAELNFSPPEPIGVILYTEQAFGDITRAPNWVGALNDGRIRVPVQGLTSMTPELSRTLKHELVHSFLDQKTRRRCPTWLHEGLAQWMEGQRAGQHAQLLAAAYDRKASLPLRVMEGFFMKMPDDVAAYAYGWSLAVVEYLIESSGLRDIERILDRLATESSPEAALKSVVRMDYPDVEEETVKYLKRAYLNQ